LEYLQEGKVEPVEIFHQAIVCGRMDLVVETIDLVNKKISKDDWTPLMRAAYWGRTEIYNYLLRNGTDTRVESKKNGVTPAALVMHQVRDLALGYFHFKLRFTGVVEREVDLEKSVESWLGKEKVKESKKEKEMQRVVVSFKTTKNSFIASVNVTDIGFAHELRNKVLMKGDILKGFELDMTPFVEHYEECVLSLNKLTKHQLKKLAACRGQPFVHLRAPAGAGKTFVAMFRIIDELEDGKRVLYVCKNEALAYSLVKWLVVRKRSENNPAVTLKDYFDNFYLQFEPLKEVSDRRATKSEAASLEQRSDDPSLSSKCRSATNRSDHSHRIARSLVCLLRIFVMTQESSSVRLKERS